MHSTRSFNAIKIDYKEVIEECHEAENQEILHIAAKLVDNGRTGTLSRI